MKGRYEQQKPRQKTAAWKKVLIIVLVALIVLVVGLIAAVVIYYNSMLNKMNKVDMNKVDYGALATATQATEEELETKPIETTVATEATEAPTTEPPHIPSKEDYINFLIVGQSGREGDAKEGARFADSSLLVTVNTYEKTLTLTSLLRDSFVRPPEYKGHHFGRIKLATVYHMGYTYSGNTIAGSMELMNMTLFTNFGIEVDHNFEVSFDSFVEILDMLGGVDVELTQPEADYLNNFLKDCDWKTYHYEAGMSHLDGWSGLAYARMRHAEGDADSDIKRTSRQQKMVAALLDKLKGMSLSDLQNLANTILPLISTNMSNSEITSTLMTMLPMLKDLKIVNSGTCPAEPYYWGEMVDIYKDGFYHSVLKFDEGKTKAHMREITLGEVPAKK